jgi:hypothetical protein
MLELDAEELSALELMGKVATKNNELVEGHNVLETKTNNLEINKENISDLEQNRKLDKNGDFTGTWHGLKPSQTNEAISSLVDSHSEDLSQKTQEISELYSSKANKDEVFTMANMGQDIREALTGGSVAVVGIKTVFPDNVNDGAVTDNKIKGLTIVSKNLFDKHNIKVGYQLHPTTGLEVVNTNYFISDYIRVDELTLYTANFTYFTCYDSNYAVIGIVTKTNNQITTLSGCFYVRACGSIASLDVYKFGAGETLPTDNYKIKFTNMDISDDYITKLDNFELLNVNNLYFKPSLSNGNIFLKFDSIIIRRGAIEKTLTFDKLKTDLPEKIYTSADGVKEVTQITNGYSLVYDFDSDKFIHAYKTELTGKNYFIIGYVFNGRIMGHLGTFVNSTDFNILNIKNNYINPNYSSLIDTKENEIISSIDSENDFVFTLSSDNHSNEAENLYTDETLLVQNHVSNNLNVDLIVNCGDSIRYGKDDKAIGIRALKHVMHKFNDNSKLFHLVGNHDYNGVAGVEQQQSWNITQTEIYNLIGSHLENDNNIVWGNKKRMYFYKDFPNKKIRVIALNSSDVTPSYNTNGNMVVNSLINCGMQQTQLDWLANVALNFNDKVNKTEWHTIILSHVGLYTEEEGLIGTNPSLINRDCVKAILKNFINGTSQSIVYSDNITANGMFTVNLSVDYTTQGSMSLIGVFSGHSHRDNYINDSVNGIHQITILSGYVDNGITDIVRTVNDFTEIAFDTIIINKSNQTVTLKRFGVGSDRSYSY